MELSIFGRKLFSEVRRRYLDSTGIESHQLIPNAKKGRNSKNEPGKILDGLGGIGGILRY